MLARIEFLCDRGPSSNPQHFRWLRDRLFELKTTGGARLVCYYDRDVPGRVIAVHGFMKPAKAGPEIAKARALRDEFERERGTRT